MRRWLTILLLVMLPLQLGWAALGSYCQHEPGSQAKHAGHHFHQHKADSERDDGDGPDPKSGKSMHADCSVCVSGDLTSLSSVDLPEVSASSTINAWFEVYPLSQPSSPPYRPAWTSLA